jgi:hypothetical protein
MNIQSEHFYCFNCFLKKIRVGDVLLEISNFCHAGSLINKINVANRNILLFKTDKSDLVIVYARYGVVEKVFEIDEAERILKLNEL